MLRIDRVLELEGHESTWSMSILTQGVPDIFSRIVIKAFATLVLLVGVMLLES